MATISPLEALVARISGRQAHKIPATCATSGYSKDPVGSLADHLLPTPTSFPPGPQGRLWALLDTWASMDEATWAEANVKALHDDILDVFRDHSEADAWFREWRAAHPEARW